MYDSQNQLLRNRLLKRPKFLQHISFSPRKCDSGNTGHRFARMEKMSSKILGELRISSKRKIERQKRSPERLLFMMLFSVFDGAGFTDDVDLDDARIRHGGFDFVGNVTGEFERG